MIADTAVHGAAHRITAEPALEGFRLDPCIELERGIERRAGGAVGDKLDRVEKATSPDIADVAMVAETLDQPPFEATAKLPHPVKQIFLADDLLHFKRCRAGHGMPHVSVTVLKRTRALPDRIDDARAGEHRSDRLVTAAKSLGDGLDIGRNALLLPGVHRAGAAHAAHHFIEDQQRAVTIADIAHRAEITLRRRHATGCCAHHGLGDEGGHRIGTEALELGFQFRRKPRHKIRLRFIVALFVIGEGRRDVAEGIRQQRRIGFSAPGIAARRQRAERIAMIALAARDEAPALRLAALDEVLPRDLDAGLDRFRSAADKIGISEPAGLMANQAFGEFFRGRRREETGMGIGQRRGLPLHRLDHARMLMSEAGDRGAAGRVQHAAAILGNQPHALAADCPGRRLAQAPVHHATGSTGHDRQPFSATYWDVSARRASVSSSRRLASAPPSMKVAAASDCAIAIAPVRLGKKPGEAAASNCSK